MKTCLACHSSKPITDFYVKKRAKTRSDGSVHTWTGYYAKCKRCTDVHNSRTRDKYKVWYSEYRKQNRERISTRTKAAYVETERQWWAIIATVHQLKCVRCGFDEHTAALDFHHRNPGEKESSIHQLTRGVPTPERVTKVLQELEKCEVLCANCHRIKHAKYNFAETVGKVITERNKG